MLNNFCASGASCTRSKSQVQFAFSALHRPCTFNNLIFKPCVCGCFCIRVYGLAYLDIDLKTKSPNAFRHSRVRSMISFDSCQNVCK